MNVVKKIIIGSYPFFKDRFDDYTPKDIDVLYLVDYWVIDDTNVINYKRDGNDIFYMRNMSKDEFINDTIESRNPLRLGKFLVPEFIEYIHLTINDLRRLEHMFDSLDVKHSYQRYIYNAYVENDEFTLNNTQLLNAYEEYKKYRK